MSTNVGAWLRGWAWLQFRLFHKVGKFGMPFNKLCNIRAAGDDLPAKLPRLVQRGASQVRGHAATTKLVRDKRVIQDDVLRFVSVVEERKRRVADPRFKLL